MDVLKIKRQIERNSEDLGLTCFPCATEEEILDFEKKYQIHLPQDYRIFLKEVANGIESEEEGLIFYSLEWVEKEMEEGFHNDFPYSTEYVNLILDKFKNRGDFHFSDILYSEEVFANQWRGMPPGCIILTYFGGDYSVLVVKGEQYGKVWRYGDVDCPETEALYVGNGHCEQIEFAEWINFWMEMNGILPQE